MKLKQTLAALTATTLFAIPSVAGAETIENMPQSQKVVAETKTLYDIQNHWAKSSIEYLVSQKIIDGYPDGTFHPEKEVTRAEFASSVARILQNSDKNKDEQQVKFIDFSINGNLEVGQEKPITFVLENADGSKKDVTNKPTYKVENTDIAVISNQKIKGLKEGKTKMTATYGDIVAEYYIEVVKPDSSDSQQSGASEYKDGEQKTIKGFVFTYHVNGNNWTDEYGFSYNNIPTFSDEVKTGRYLLRVPIQDLYGHALINIADSGAPLTKDEFINAYKEVVKTKKDVVINNVRFTYSPSYSGGDEDYVLMIVG